MKKFIENLKPQLLPVSLTLGFAIIIVILRFTLANYNSAYITQIYKPPFYPPNFVFYLAWIVVYAVLITAIILTLIKSKNKSLIINIIFNGALNILLPLFFFILKSKLSGVLILLFLIISSVYLFKMILNIKRWYACLLIPYLLWLSFLIVLNYSILMIN